MQTVSCRQILLRPRDELLFSPEFNQLLSSAPDHDRAPPCLLRFEPARKQRGPPALKAGDLLPRQLREDSGRFGVAPLDLLRLAPEVGGIEPRGAIKRVI